MMTTQAFKSLLEWFRSLLPSRPLIEISLALWQEMIEELGRRSLGGRREAGVFLLAPAKERTRQVVRAAYFDDLDPECLVGNIHIRASGFSKLWELCDSESLRVIADIHTHPSTMVSQSSTDRANPMIAREGYLALIVPHYGTRPVQAREVGVHEYRGDQGWASWFGPKAERVLGIRSS